MVAYADMSKTLSKKTDTLPRSNKRSNICRSTCREASNSETTRWYLPSWAVEREPITKAGPFSEADTDDLETSSDGGCVATGAMKELIIFGPSITPLLDRFGSAAEGRQWADS